MMPKVVLHSSRRTSAWNGLVISGPLYEIAWVPLKHKVTELPCRLSNVT